HGPLPKFRFFYTILKRLGKEGELDLLKFTAEIPAQSWRPILRNIDLKSVSMVILDLSRENSVERGAEPSRHCFGYSTLRRGAQRRRTVAGDLLIQLMHNC
ncbi:hypothetical protein KUF71_023702, partial [Frankliniella fusca]